MTTTSVPEVQAALERPQALPFKSLPLKKPEWLKVRPPSGEAYTRLKGIRQQLKLATVCEEARCPNIGECWAGGTATFMLMGDTCTRGCRFCAVKTGNPNGWLDATEPQHIAETVQTAGWHYVVLTSVDRDDLPDGGAVHFAQTVQAVKRLSPQTTVEVLIPDFRGQVEPLRQIVKSGAEVIAQNLETVERLTHPVRDPRAGYQQTLTLLARIKDMDDRKITKSSLMLGLGETDDELHQAMHDLRAHGVDILTLGQYLQPTPKHLPVQAFIPPEQFETWQQIAQQTYGFLYCASGPLVRSSYRAGEFFIQALIQRQKGDRQNVAADDKTQNSNSSRTPNHG